ncbi:hypothetical protein EUGRSUZ_L02689 [Eucalyptus grandis]|uniref:Uncharacterized protein n=1 Tax=Eucalyptus grandis TaxID=71139 RepID=A0AAD9T9I1_EUCGR|nr:hypothetical protein EUGRSUZ_L02689 [Eucalyptus grandis]
MAGEPVLSPGLGPGFDGEERLALRRPLHWDCPEEFRADRDRENVLGGTQKGLWLRNETEVEAAMAYRCASARDRERC